MTAFAVYVQECQAGFREFGQTCHKNLKLNRVFSGEALQKKSIKLRGKGSMILRTIFQKPTLYNQRNPCL